MSLISPLALLAAAIIGPIIVAMYLLKLRREERTVSSTFLWQQVIRDVEANAPWQKLRYNLLLLLQILLMLLLVFALARPFFATQGISGRNLIIILDRSASMAASDTPPSRLDTAKATALQLIDQLPDGGRATLILVGGTLEVPAAASGDRRELRAAIQAVALANGGGSDLAQALSLAAALAARDEQSEVAIISDGNLSLPNDIRVPARVSYFPIGNSSENSGISAIALEAGQNSQTLFVQVSNYGSQAVERRLNLYLDGALFNAYTLNLAPDLNQSQNIVVDVPPTVQQVEARLAGSDVLPADDRAFAISTFGSQLNVRLLSSGNHFLETGLSLLPNISLNNPNASAAPLSIIDGAIPDSFPAGNLLFIGPLRSTDYFSVTGQIDFPSLRAVSNSDPVLKNISLSEVSVLKAARIVPGSWARVLVTSDGAPMLMVGERDGRRIAVLAFDLHNSDLPLQIAFPLLLSNLIEYLAPGGSGAQLSPSQTLALPLDPSITEVRISRPDRSQASSGSGAIQIRAGQAIYADTDMLGIYHLEALRDGSVVQRRSYAVNADPQESPIRPQADLRIPQTSGAESTTARNRDGRQEIWRWLALAALIVLVIEWLVYQRNGLVLLRQRWMR
ncbi:hypothetical protein OSCT_1968 [Oscillochloris trichoides DG-6]|uniref:VWFA domain-containing protein n=1 Tax=Oscillochloris trichoides DG-6 TaxID=765420 RepID=E1IF67_9CHLR|nr:BatA and WFA domain-containing protein [Oscillochloris trichoides]EFO80166.1 hypothetical protein OSCT_1968 [Oscillochloris trichoides DG-6]